MSVYTKRGDRGETGLFSSDRNKPRRVSKSSLIINAIGSVDEANSYLGVVAAETKIKDLRLKINDIQRDLFTIGAILAGAGKELQSYKVTKLKSYRGQPKASRPLDEKELEREIDKMEEKLPKLTGFILPGGSRLAAGLFFARALVRRAERSVVSVSHLLSTTYYILPYLNRLSDYLFILARWVNFKAKLKELKWRE